MWNSHACPATCLRQFSYATWSISPTGQSISRGQSQKCQPHSVFLTAFTGHWHNSVSFRFFSFRSPSLLYLLVHSRCRGCLLSLDHTQTHTTVVRTPLDEGSARRRDLYLTTRTLYKRKKIHPPGEIRTHNPSKRSAADPRLRPRGHWDRPQLRAGLIQSLSEHQHLSGPPVTRKEPQLKAEIEVFCDVTSHRRINIYRRFENRTAFIFV
jgi:hypothetical protein